MIKEYPSQVCLDSPKEEEHLVQIQLMNDLVKLKSLRMMEKNKTVKEIFYDYLNQIQKQSLKVYGQEMPKIQRRISVKELKQINKNTENLMYKIKLRNRIIEFNHKLRNQSLQRGINQLQQKYYNLINDQSNKEALKDCQYNSESSSEKFNNIQKPRKIRNKSRAISLRTYKIVEKMEKFQKIKNTLVNIPVIKQSSLFFLFWNIILLICIISNFYAIPLRIIYQQEYYTAECILQPFIIFQLSVFILDIVINLNTVVIIQDEFVYKRGKILKKYIKSSKFIIDVISLGGFYMSISQFFDNHCITTKNYWQLFGSFLFYFKYFKISKLYKHLERQFSHNQNYIVIIKLSRLLINFFILAHYVASIWIITGLYGLKTQSETWLENYSLWNNQYITSLYFALMTMTTVGYGDVVPKNDIEKVVNMLIMVLACAAFGYIINKVSGIIDEMTDQKNQYHKELNIINKYMQKLNINQDLRIKIRNYLKIYWKTNLISQFNEEAKALGHLCKSLQEELILDHLGQILQRNPILKKTFSVQFIQQLSLKMEQSILSPDEEMKICDVLLLISYIYDKTEGQYLKKFLCVGLGQAKIFYEFQKKKVLLNTLEEGDQYGLNNMFSFNENIDKDTSITANSFSLIYQITKDEFINLLKKFPEDYEKYCELRDQFFLSQKQSSEKCLICRSKDHTHINCNYVHFFPNRSWIIHKDNFSINQKRQKDHIRINKKLVNNSKIKFSLKGKINSLKNINYFIQEHNDLVNKFSEQSQSSLSSLSKLSSSLQKMDSVSQKSNNEKKEESDQAVKIKKSTVSSLPIKQSMNSNGSPEKKKILSKNKTSRLFLNFASDEMQTQQQKKELIYDIVYFGLIYSPKNQVNVIIILLNQLQLQNVLDEYNSKIQAKIRKNRKKSTYMKQLQKKN